MGVYAEIARFEQANPLNGHADFIFKGKIEQIIEADIRRREKANDPVRVHELGDAQGGTFYNLFPVEDGKVSFMGWPFDEAEVVSEFIYTVTSKIDEKSFVKQFTRMIEEAKGGEVMMMIWTSNPCRFRNTTI